jgi:hypothetical protein
MIPPFSFSRPRTATPAEARASTDTSRLAYLFRPPVLIVLLGLAYLAALVAMPPEALTHHDTGAKYLQVRNLRLTPGGLDYSINYPARPLDPGLDFVPFRERYYYSDGQDRIYLQWPIFLALLTRVPWKLMGFWGLYFVPFLGGLGACWATYLLALAAGAPRRIAWLAIPLLGLATPLAIYALLFFEHTLSAMLVALSLVFAARAATALLSARAAAESGVRWWQRLRAWLGTPAGGMAASGALLSLAVYFRSDLYIMAVVAGGLYALLAVRSGAWRRLFFAWASAFLLMLVPLWAFYAITEGTLLPLHATYYFAGSEGPSAPGAPATFSLPALRYIVQAGWGVVPDFLLGAQAFPWSPQYPVWAAALGVVGVVLCGVAALGHLLDLGGRASPWRLALMAAGLTGAGAAALYVLLSPQPYRNLHGFLIAAPFVALALWPPDRVFLPGLRGITAQGLVYVVTLAHVGLHFLVISALSGLGPASRQEWGQRYLFNAYPGLVALALLAGWRIWMEYGSRAVGVRPILRRAALAVLTLGVLLALIGLGYTARGYGVQREERAMVRDWLDMAATLPGRTPLVTDEWWLTFNLAADFYTRPIMLAQGDDRMAEWANVMRERGVTSFGLFTDKRETLDGAWRERVPGLAADGPPQEASGAWLQRYTLGP